MEEVINEVIGFVENSKFLKNIKKIIEYGVCIILVIIGMSTYASQIQRAKGVDKQSIKTDLKKLEDSYTQQGNLVTSRDPKVDILLSCSRGKEVMLKVARQDLKSKTRESYVIK